MIIVASIRILSFFLILDILIWMDANILIPYSLDPHLFGTAVMALTCTMSDSSVIFKVLSVPFFRSSYISIYILLYISLSSLRLDNLYDQIIRRSNTRDEGSQSRM